MDVRRPTVLTMDTLDDRREVWVTLCRHLPPARRVDFLDWCCALLREQMPHLRTVSQVRAARGKMAATVAAAARGDRVADVVLANEVYADVTQLCHGFGLDFSTVAAELESWAKGRGPTPPAAAAASLRGVTWQARSTSRPRSAAGPSSVTSPGPLTEAR